MILTKSNSRGRITIKIVITPVIKTYFRILMSQAAQVTLVNLLAVSMCLIKSIFKVIHHRFFDAASAKGILHHPSGMYPQQIPLTTTSKRSFSSIISMCHSHVQRQRAKAQTTSISGILEFSGKCCIHENNVFTLVELKPDMDVPSCRHVSKVNNGAPKVRIVAKGFCQVQGVDHYKPFSKVVSFGAMRSFLAIAVRHDLYLYLMDVVTAFLNGDLYEDIYMEVPSGVKGPYWPHLVRRLLKALYGLI